MRFASYEGRYLPERPESIWGHPAGTFWWGDMQWTDEAHGKRTYRALWCVLPHSYKLADGTVKTENHPSALPVSGDVPPDSARWEWDGNAEAPTLNPSILCGGR
ncbi:MAG: hypothetical protein OXC11_16505, partial [Rhodospirillales bacterium]|nr:hypothetical protein [Rhodospirillales bacterium]